MSQATNFDGAQLLCLSNLIQQSVKDVLGEYEKIGSSIPSLESIAPGPFDKVEQTTSALRQAVRVIQSACHQLSLSVSDPGLTMLSVRFIKMKSHKQY